MHLDLPILLASLLLTRLAVASAMSSHSSKVARSGFDAKRSPDLYSRASCEPADPVSNVTDRLNQLLSSGGAGYTLSLCPNQNYPITAPLQFTAPDQEISTQGLPTDGSRAMLTVSGPVMQPNIANHTTAVLGQCSSCNGVKLRHIQINGSRNGAPPLSGGANVEMGGPTSGQLVEYVHSFDTRAWSCLHIAEGGLKCSNTTVQNNDVGPCGTDVFNHWADGISVACANSNIRNNLVNTPTDGGIVLFGAPGTLVENNTVWVETHTLLGGINLVDFKPWSGNFTGTVVRNNNIIGGLATSSPTSPQDTKGTDDNNAIIRVGIAMGPRVWFGNRTRGDLNYGGTVLDNRFEGAFGYAMGISSVRNFTVQNNILVGNTSFIGIQGPRCSSDNTTPASQPFVAQKNNITESSIQSDFTNVPDADSLICVAPPAGASLWPYGGSHDPSAPPPIPDGSSTAATAASNQGMSTGAKVGIGIGVISGILFIAVLAWFIRKRVLDRHQSNRQMAWASPRAGYEPPKEH